MTKKQKLIYWSITALFLLPMAGSGVLEALLHPPASTAATFTHLGYPPYLLTMLGVAKILGAAAIVSGQSRRLKEWAYAGYVFDLLGAVVSHLVVGDGPLALVPASILGLVLGSYSLWTRALPSKPAIGAA
jgi:hypothetical protein